MHKITFAQINANVALFSGKHEKNKIPGLEVPFRYWSACFYLPGRTARQLDIEKILVRDHDKTGAIHAAGTGSTHPVTGAFPRLHIGTNIPFNPAWRFVL